MSYYKRKYLIKIRKLDSNLTMASQRLEYGTQIFNLPWKHACRWLFECGDKGCACSFDV